MAEPDEVAETSELVIDGVWHWRIQNHRIGGAISSSQAVAGEGEMVLIDPVRLAPQALAALPIPTSICLTAKCHQRAAWRYRGDFAAAVWAPEGTVPMDGEPDHRYREGDMLPGGLRAVHTPGPEPVHYSFLREREPGVVFCSDLLGNDPAGGLGFVPPEFHDDPAETRRSVERLLDLPFTVLCLDHGPPVTVDAKGAIRALLRRTGE
jgi:glyoxylase-like metal-dependent hydrolase (beta-lactamase superfamily II)